MSTDCPPQLQLSIQPNTTSFKRSFEQFGFDLDSPVAGATGAGANAATSDGRTDRNKRARSTISFESETSSDSSSDTLASTSSSGSSRVSEGGATGAFPAASLIEPARLPTPDTQDVDMPDYPITGDHRESSREVTRTGDRYHLSLQRFNQFDSEIALLRQSPSSTTSPPTLPPLRHRLLPDDVAFFRRHTPSVSSPFSSDFFDENPPTRTESGSSQTLPPDIISVSEIANPPFDLLFRETQSLPPLSLPGINPTTSAQLSPPSSPASTAGFRDRLNTALDRLRSPSPLVPGLEDSDPELRVEEDDMEDSDEEQDSEDSLQAEENRSRTDELPPVLPPIQTTENVFHHSVSSESGLQAPSPTSSVPPNPPTLPPIPTVTTDAHAADRGWHGRGQLYTERLDDFMDLSRNPPSALERDFMDHSPLRSLADARAIVTSPRPFSRSAGPSLSSSNTHQSLMANTSLGDHPLPSPILRDLHSWIEERQPALPADGHHNHTLARADGASSVSSNSTTAATAGTDLPERDAFASAMSSSASAGSAAPESASTDPHHHDRLSRMLDRIRTGGRVDDWAGHNNRRPWLSHAAPWIDSSAETNIPHDSLSWYPSSSTPASASAIPNVTPEASRPISTTPALAPTNAPRSPGRNPSLDSFWEPVFTNLPEANFTRPPRATPPSENALASGRQWHSTRPQPQDGAAVRSGGIRYGDRQSPSAADSSRVLPSSTSPGGDIHSGYLNYFGMLTSEAAGRRSDPVDVSNSRDNHANDTTTGLWRPLESTELPLEFYFNTSSNPANATTTNANSNPRHSSTTSAYNDADPARPTYRSVMRNAFGIAQLPSLNLDNSPPVPSSPASRLPPSTSAINAHAREREELARRAETRRLMERRYEMQTLRGLLATGESPRPPAPSSSLSNWNGRAHGASPAQPPPTVSPSAIGIGTNAAPPNLPIPGAEYERSSSTSVDSRRTDPRLRHRLIRSYSQNRPGSSSSLVTENASEVRRRADHAELRRAYPGERRPSVGDNDNEGLSTDSNESAGQAEVSWENEILERAWGHRWRSRLNAASGEVNSGSAAEPSRHFHHALHSSTSDLMDTSESITSLPITQNTADAAPVINQSYPVEAPSLPPPDLGSSFIAGPQTRLMANQWTSEHVPMDTAMEPTMSSTPADTLFSIDTTNNRTNVSPRHHHRPRPVSTAVPLDLRHLRAEQQSEGARHLYQMMDDRMLHARDRHLQFERVQESRRLLESAARVREYVTLTAGAGSDMPHPRSGPLPVPTLSGNLVSIVNPTTATSIASASNASRPPANQTRRASGADPSGRYTHFDPSTFAAGPFRNTLQHFANEREGPAPRSESNVIRPYMRHPPHIPPLSFDGEADYPLSSPTRLDPAGGRSRSTVQTPREGDEADRGITPRSRNTVQGDLNSRAEAAPRPPHFYPPSNESILNNDSNTTRWISETQRFAIADRYRSQYRRQEAARLEDASRHVRDRTSSAGEDQTRLDSINPSRIAPAMHRHRRMASHLEDDDDATSAELLQARAARNPRRMMRGNSIMLSRLPPSNNTTMGLAWRRGRPMGDFMRDEDFDASYENLLSLSMQIGDVKPRATPSEVLAKMKKGLYRDFAAEGTDTRCPICLDDYEPTDPVQKLNNCSHWLHEGCLSQWLLTANTCPVCRESVTSPRSSPFGGHRVPRFRAMPFHLHAPPRRRRDSSPTISPPQVPPAAPPSRRNGHLSGPSARNMILEDLDLDDIQGLDNQESNGSNQGSPNRANFGAPWRYYRP